METAHLLRSPKNAQRLLSALQDSLSEEGKVQGVDSLAKEVGFVS
jgi:antitoxin YefM